MIRVADLKMAALAVMIVLACAVSGPEDRVGQVDPSQMQTKAPVAKVLIG